MNLWAHMVLGYPNPEHQTGQFLGDFCRGPVEDLPFSPGVLHGIRSHRKVDAIGDQHAFTREAKSFLPPEERRYGGLVLDLLCDWLLHENWEQVCQENKLEVIDSCEVVLNGDRNTWPRSANHLARLVLDHDLLHAYGQLSEIRYAVGRMGTRLRRPVDLHPLLDKFIREERWLHTHFPSYFRDLIRVVEDIT